MRKNSRTKSELRLWAIDICPGAEQSGLTVVLMAVSTEDALRRAEERYPHFFSGGSRGFALAIDHAALHWRDGEFNTVEVGRWWGRRCLRDFRREQVH